MRLVNTRYTPTSCTEIGHHQREQDIKSDHGPVADASRTTRSEDAGEYRCVNQLLRL